MPLLKFTNKLSRQWTYTILLLGLLISTSLGISEKIESDFSVQLGYQFLDSYLKYTASGKAAQRSIVIDIDDMSLSAVGQWPWPRYRMASLVKNVADAKPASIGLDILFSEPDRTSLSNIQKSFKHDFGLDISFVGASPGLADNDGYFGHVLSTTGAVGARYFYFDHTSKADVNAKPEFDITGETDQLSLNNASGVLNNIAEISSQLEFSGFLNNQPDGDGMYRRVPLLIQYNGIVYPHLSLATYMRSLGVKTAVIENGRNGAVVHVGNHLIPINKSGYALLRFNGKPQLYPAISALEILNGTFNTAELKDKIVFIGSSAAALNDLHSTIFDSQFSGLKMQAVIIENLVNDSFIREPSWAATIIFLVCIAIGFLVSVLFIYLREPLQLFIGTALLTGFILIISICLFQAYGIFVSPGMPVLVILILFTFFIMARFAIEKKQAYVWFKQLANARQVTIESMAAVAETRDPETGAHIKRTQLYVRAIAEKLKNNRTYLETLTDEFIELLYVSAPLHDIGKVGVPDHILLKPGKLTEEEFVLMKKHAEYGKNIIYSTTKKMEGDNFLIVAGEIASTHHEKWDGTGYPLGLAGQTIPLSGRIMAVADVYDALISRRCYKPPFSHEKAFGIMREERGKIFDPEILDAFFSIEDEIKAIASKYQDDNERVLGDR